jgi:hyperosmotically inducible protein
MQNHKMLSRLLAAALVSLASVAAVSVHAADPAAAPPGATSGSGSTYGSGSSSATGAPSATGATSATGAGPAPSATSAYADDSMITTMVKAALLEDKQVQSLKISVSTAQGVVKMSGTVPSADVGRHALQLAAAVQGVKEVKNDLKLKG